MSQVQQVRVRGRNFDDVVRQLVEKYNSSEGWAVVKVVPSVITMDVYLERNEEQAKGASNANNENSAKKTTKAQEVKLDDDKEATKGAKSTKSTARKGETESKTASAGGSAVNAPKAKTTAKTSAK